MTYLDNCPYTEIFHDAEIEPALLPLTGEQLHATANAQDEARLDISIDGFWQRGQRAFFDVRVFNPFVPSYRNEKLSTAFNANEREKNRNYTQIVIDIHIDHGSFTPLVFTPYSGSSRETEKFISVLASSIAEKLKIAISITTNWIRSKLSFALLRSSIYYVFVVHVLYARNITLPQATLHFDPALTSFVMTFDIDNF